MIRCPMLHFSFSLARVDTVAFPSVPSSFILSSYCTSTVRLSVSQNLLLKFGSWRIRILHVRENITVLYSTSWYVWNQTRNFEQVCEEKLVQYSYLHFASRAKMFSQHEAANKHAEEIWRQRCFRGLGRKDRIFLNSSIIFSRSDNSKYPKASGTPNGSFSRPSPRTKKKKHPPRTCVYGKRRLRNPPHLRIPKSHSFDNKLPALDLCMCVLLMVPTACMWCIASPRAISMITTTIDIPWAWNWPRSKTFIPFAIDVLLGDEHAIMFQ